MAPATTIPEQAPMDWMIIFSRIVLFLLKRPAIPTARMAIGIAASKTWATLSPRKAAAPEKRAAITVPQITERKVTSGISLLLGTKEV